VRGAIHEDETLALNGTGPSYHMDRNNLLVLESKSDVQKRSQVSLDEVTRRHWPLSARDSGGPLAAGVQSGCDGHCASIPARGDAGANGRVGVGHGLIRRRET
jgi:hypothetical protein